jgi:hypothetical protein
MQDNKAGTWLARDGDGRVLEVDADGYPGAEANPDDGRPVAEQAARARPQATERRLERQAIEYLLERRSAEPAAPAVPGRDTAWAESYREHVAGLQQRNRAYLAARAQDLARELEPEAG